jgi:hypothetical protein
MAETPAHIPRIDISPATPNKLSVPTAKGQTIAFGCGNPSSKIIRQTDQLRFKKFRVDRLSSKPECADREFDQK